ncbi:metallopeptidase TldD-related protein [Dubosiella newyorkensis]|uniref:metallopeptidase TldD-related protein n=1 Tax=Dubosiella newyorkensis TaxID=1862672 RepID=UPI003F671396
MLVDHGVFEQALYDIKSAIKMNTESTGNGFNLVAAPSMRAVAMNLSISSQRKIYGLMEQMQNGLVITDLMRTASGIHFVSTHSLAGFRIVDQGWKKIRAGHFDHDRRHVLWIDESSVCRDRKRYGLVV